MDSIKTRLENAKLASAIDSAEIVIHLSQGAAVVTLWDAGEEIGFASNRESIGQTIRDAIDCARHRSGMGVPKS